MINGKKTKVMMFNFNGNFQFMTRLSLKYENVGVLKWDWKMSALGKKEQNHGVNCYGKQLISEDNLTGEINRL